MSSLLVQRTTAQVNNVERSALPLLTDPHATNSPLKRDCSSNVVVMLQRGDPVKA